jgi:hypothetical protein
MNIHKNIPVVNRDKRLVGILSLGDLPITGGRGGPGEALAEISRRGGQHSQMANSAHSLVSVHKHQTIDVIA